MLHTPDIEATKCWSGNLGKIATHAIVYAQLYTPDGQHHGLNAFVVPVRDIRTLKPFPGVLVGDMGKKIGLNGLANGYVSALMSTFTLLHLATLPHPSYSKAWSLNFPMKTNGLLDPPPHKSL